MIPKIHGALYIYITSLYSLRLSVLLLMLSTKGSWHNFCLIFLRLDPNTCIVFSCLFSGSVSPSVGIVGIEHMAEMKGIWTDTARCEGLTMGMKPQLDTFQVTGFFVGNRIFHLSLEFLTKIWKKSLTVA